MNNEEKALIKAKRIQCIIGIIFLIPPILCVLGFVYLIITNNDPGYDDKACMAYKWIFGYDYNGADKISFAPIYIGMMAFIGAYLIKDSLIYFFIKDEKPKEKAKTEE